MQKRPIVIFDTSVHNRLLKDGLESEAIFAALESGYLVRLAAISIDELIATPDAEMRLRLLATAGRLRQHEMSDCLHPQNEMLRLLIPAYEANPQTFDWCRVTVSSREYEKEISARKFSSDDALAAEQRQHISETRKEFNAVWSNARPLAGAILQRDGQARPRSLSEILPHAMGENGVFWSMARGLYERAAKMPATDASIQHFVEACPPFRCAVYAMLMAWYDRSLRDWNGGEKFHAGRNDLFMAVYLPYCNQFVTAEQDGEQERCLAEVARLAGVPTLVRSYDDFCCGLLLPLSA